MCEIGFGEESRSVPPRVTDVCVDQRDEREGEWIRSAVPWRGQWTVD